MIQSEPKVKILLDSISPDGIRLTTFQLEFWRAILPELNTHRVLSKNARSSRATPIEKNIEQVRNKPWGPRTWGLNQKGMSAAETLKDEMLSRAKAFWESSAQEASYEAQELAKMGLHKQIVNRMLEPYMPITVILSATDLKNFFKLRISPLAQPEMQDLALAMKIALEASTPKQLQYGDWHLPYITKEEMQDQYDLHNFLQIVSAARCARVSYKAFDGTTSLEADYKLGMRLLENKHMSAFEHIATPAKSKEYILSNFRGWNQYRKFIKDEAVKG